MTGIGDKLRRLAALVLVTAACSPVHGQAVREKFTAQEVKYINEQCKTTLELFINHLNFIADPGIAREDMEEAIDGQFSEGRSKIFFQEKFKVMNDLAPKYHETGDESADDDIKDYLKSFRNRYIQKEENSIRFKITETSPIYIGERYPIVRLYYTLYLHGATPEGARFKDELHKVMYLHILQYSTGFRALIFGIGSADKDVPAANLKEATITGAADGTTPGEVTAKGSAYYRGMLSKGMRQLNNNSYAPAYYSLSEAKGSPEPGIRAGADQGFKSLISKMRSKDMNIKTYLSTELATMAKSFDATHRYEEARQSLRYALEERPEEYNSLNGPLQVIEGKINKMRQLNLLLDKGAYKEAETQFVAALKLTPRDPNLQLGLARAYYGQGFFKEAEKSFDEIIQKDASYAPAYLWQGKMYLDMKLYVKAYDALVKHKQFGEESADPEIDANLAFTRGLILLKKGEYTAALDSLRASGHPKAAIFEAQIYKEQNDPARAQDIVRKILKKDDKDADAYFMRGQLLMASNNAGNTERNRRAAIGDFKTAISYAPNHYQWYYELAELQVQEKQYDEAIQNFTACLEKSGNGAILTPYWGRGKCYYLQNRDMLAYDDYKRYFDSARLKSSAFYVDYGRLLIRLEKFEDARSFFTLARQDQYALKEALLGLGVLAYMQNPRSPEVYMKHFEDAFAMQVSKESVATDRYISKIFAENKDFAKLVKRYKYTVAQ